jgi:MoxR-like ATPase
VGKTTLARALAATLDLTVRRIQFTSDLLPSDILGSAVYDPRTVSFAIRPGPIFSNIVVADEINRAPPRTQSGLLEAMQEGRVTIDEGTHDLPAPFFVMATQNPLEHHGTYPLPESQLDRFVMRLTIGYPDAEAERRILLESVGVPDPVSAVAPVLRREDVLALQVAVEAVHCGPDVVDYLLAIVRATREHPGLRMGVSPRGAIGLFRCARAHALLDGRAFIVPDDVRALAIPCLAHRLLPAGAVAATVAAQEESAAVIGEIVRDAPAPL